MNNNRVEMVISEYKERFESILKRIWPTIGDTGFVEKNQTANFIEAYEKCAKMSNEIVSVWYEFPIPNDENNKKNNHIDAIVINHTKKEILLVEAKRISKNKVPAKRRELAMDLQRIQGLDLSNRFSNFFLKEIFNEYVVYGVLLFDAWNDNQPAKKAIDIWKNYCNDKKLEGLYEFLFSSSKTGEGLVNTNIENIKTIIPRLEEIKIDGWNNTYYLGCMLWKIED